MAVKYSRKLAAAAMLAALTCVTTAFISFPIGFIPGAYVHAGDTVIFAAAYMLGPWVGAAASALGSAGADLIRGSFVYVLPTFVIKGVMGLVAGLFFRGRTLKGHVGRFSAAFALCAAVVVAGYFVCEWPLYGLPVALASAPFNLLQAAASTIFAVGGIVIIEKTPALVTERETLGGGNSGGNK